jgi:hypothetical protein
MHTIPESCTHYMTACASYCLLSLLANRTLLCAFSSFSLDLPLGIIGRIAGRSRTTQRNTQAAYTLIHERDEMESCGCWMLNEHLRGVTRLED